MIKKLVCIFFILLFGILHSSSFAQQLIKIDENLQLNLVGDIKIYHSEKSLDYNSFKENYKNLKPSKDIKPNYTNWIVFKLSNNSKDNDKLYISTNFSDSLRLYNFSNAKLIGLTGYGYNFIKLSRPTESSYLKFNIPPKTTKLFVLQLNGSYPTHKVYFLIENAGKIINFDNSNYIKSVSLIAVILAFIVFNFLVFLILRDKTYVYYLFYLITLLLYLSTRTFVIQYQININAYWVDYILIDIFLILFNLSAIHFSLSYFRLDLNTVWGKIFKWYKYLFLIPIVLSIVYYKDYYNQPENIVLAILSLTTIILILIFSISNYSKKSQATLLFLLAESPMLLAGIYISIEFCIIDLPLSDRLGPYIFQLSVILEILLFSFALGNRYREQRLLWLEQVDENNHLKTQRLLELQALTEQKNKELEELVIARTTELKSSNLKLIKSNEEKNKIFTILGHDLKSPLSSLQMMLDLFLTKDLDEKEFKELALSIKQNLRGINDAIQNIFNWAQSQMKGEVLEILYFNLLNLIQDKVNLLSLVLQTKNIQFSLTVNEELMAFADKNQIGIVIHNVLNNAIKFTDINGKIEIYASLIVNKIEITIKDNGKGMSTELIERIKNHQLIGSKKGTLGEVGTGLGMIICKEILQKNNGELEIYSEIDKGTYIKIIIPAVHI